MTPVDQKNFQELPDYLLNLKISKDVKVRVN